MSRSTRSPSVQTAVPRRLRVYQLAGICLALLLGILAVYGRCHQMDRAKSRALEAGITALATSLERESGERGDGDFSEAERAFLTAATESVRDPFPRFCLSAIRELRGEQPVDQMPPAGWDAAIAHLSEGRLQAARDEFELFRESEPPFSFRAELYQRLIDELAAHTTDDRH